MKYLIFAAAIRVGMVPRAIMERRFSIVLVKKDLLETNVNYKTPVFFKHAVAMVFAKSFLVTIMPVIVIEIL